MTLFLDVDALHKLGAYDALSAALDVLGVQPQEVWVLSTARFKLRLKDEAQAAKRHGPATATRLRAFIGTVNEVTQAPTPTEAAQLENVPGLDAGEMILIASAAREPGARLLTGDKNALRALSSEPRCSSFAARLEGHVVCLEQVLEALMAKHGFEWLHGRVLSSPGTDAGLTRIVAPGMGASEANAVAGFSSTIADLRKQTGALLATRLSLKDPLPGGPAQP